MCKVYHSISLSVIFVLELHILRSARSLVVFVHLQYIWKLHNDTEDEIKEIFDEKLLKHFVNFQKNSPLFIYTSVWPHDATGDYDTHLF